MTTNLFWILKQDSTLSCLATSLI